MDLLNEMLENDEFNSIKKINDFSVKIYNNSDFKCLMELYERVFPHYISKELWQWKNKKNPFGNSLIFIMKDGDQIISHYNIVPKDFYIYGKKFPCVQSMDTMTDSDYRGLGLFTYLGKLSYRYAKEKGFFFVYGFPNKVIYKLREVKLGWTNFGNINLFIKRIEPNTQPLKNDNYFIIKEIKSFTNEINDFWNEYKNNYPLIIKKDSGYLNWRFTEHPFVKYKKFLIINNNTGKIISYFVLKRYNDKKGNNVGHIIDYLIGPQEKSLKREIFKLIENYSHNDFREDCSKILFWLPDDDLKELIINDLGYHKTEMETYFGYKIFNYTQQLDTLKIWKNWYITMANSDIF